MKNIVNTCKFVVENSKHVKIHLDKINEFVDYFNESHIMHWFEESPFNLKKLNRKDRLHFLLVFNAISFSYWGDPKWRIEYNEKEVDGAYGMIASIARAVEEGVPILNADFLSKISEKSFGNILRGNTQIPLFLERLNILQQVGKTLILDFKGDFTNAIIEARGDSQKLLGIIIKSFPSFKDESVYDDKKIFFYKRAQLLVADIVQAFEDEDFANLKNYETLTACADYKLPFVLRRRGIFTYSKFLAEKIDNKIEIKKDSIEEVELRANTIWVVELLKEKIKNKIPNISSVYINDHIWMLGQIKYENDRPYHLTRTISY